MNPYSTKYLMLKVKKLQAIINKEKTVTKVAVELCTSRQSVHKWLNRYRRFGLDGILPKKGKGGSGGHNRTSKELEDVVIQLAEENYVDGVQSLADQLEAQGIYLNPSTIYRILKRRGVRYDEHWSHTQRQKKKQLYAHKEAGRELQVDTKYPFGYKVGVVVYTAIDDASRWSYCKVYATANAENTVDFLGRLNSVAPFTIQKIRTDCGTEFLAKKVKVHLKTKEIIHRANTPYCPEENGKIERFHRTLNEKAISLYWYPSDSIETLQYKLVQFLAWYNNDKRHRGLGMNGLTPQQKLIQLTSSTVNLTLQCNII